MIRSPNLSLLLAHHHPEEYERCTFIHGVPVCRRCLFLYVPTLIVLTMQTTSMAFPEAWDILLFGLGVPATLEFVLERLRVLHYHPSRVIVGSVLLSLPLGRGFMHYFEDARDPRFWGMVLFFGVPAFGAAVWRAWRDYLDTQQ